MRSFLSSIVVVLALGSLMLTGTVNAQTPTPEWINFYSSNSTVEGQSVPVGAVVQAYDPSGVLCGQSVVSVAGSYGFLACYLDDPNTPVDEGIEPGDLVRFTIDRLEAGKFQVPISIQNGDRFEADLSAVKAPPPCPTVIVPWPGATVVTGQWVEACAGFTVQALDEDGNVLGSGTVQADGSFSITLSRPVESGERLRVVGSCLGRDCDVPFPYPVPIPEPATLLLLGSGLAGLAGYVRLRSRKRRQ